MVSSTFKAVVAFLALVQVVIADYSITAPVDGTIWQEGSTVFILWTKLNTNHTEVTTTLQLLEGSATALQLKSTIDINVDPDALNYTWVIPTTLTPNSDYAISIGNPPNVFYSHFFGIAAQGQTTVPIASTAAAVSSAAASSSVYTPPTSVASSTSAPASASSAASVSNTAAGTTVSAVQSSTPSASTTAKSGAEVLRVGASILALVPVVLAAMYL